MKNQAVTDYIELAPKAQGEILSKLRELIFSIEPNAVEQFKWKRPVYSQGKDFAYLLTTKKNVTLGFFEFDKIKTNAQKIEGTGKSMRHVKISNLSDIEDLQLKSMIQEVLS